MDRYTYPGRDPFFAAESVRLKLEDTESNHAPVARATSCIQIKFIENHIGQAAENRGGGPEVQSQILSHCESQIRSLELALAAGRAMVRSACKGLELPVPDWAEPDAEDDAETKDAEPGADSKPKRGRTPKPPV